MASNKKMSTKTMVLGAIMTALVIVVQLVSTYTTFFGPFSTALALIPIVIGAAMCGSGIGAWLGFVFGMVVMLTGGANLFFAQKYFIYFIQYCGLKTNIYCDIL